MRTFHFTPQMKNFRTKLLLGGLGNLLLVFVGVCTALAAAALIASAERQTDSYIILALIIAAGVLLALPSIRPITYQFRQYRQLGEPDRKSYENETSVNGLPLRRAIIEGKLSGIELDGVTTEDVLEMSKGVSYKKTDIGMVATQTAYYSAADLCGIIEEACRMALEKLQASGSTTPIPLTRDMFESAFKKIPPSISQELLDEYNNFR